MGFTYSSSIVAKLAGINTETLFRWLDDGRLDEPPRDDAGRRVFTAAHVARAMDIVGMGARRRISIVNQKGGVGKTTSAFNLAACLAYRGRRVLAIDLDAQANLTLSFGFDPDQVPLSSENLLTDDSVTIEQVIQKTAYEGLDVVPADIRLAGADIKLREMLMREKILLSKLEPVLDHYDFVLFDCPPNLSTITINALVASTDALIPMETQCYSIKAIHDLTKTLNLLRDRMRHEIDVWVLPTKIDRRIKLSAQLLEAIEHSFAGRVLPPIRTDAALMKAPMVREPVIFAFPRSRGASDYHAVCREVLTPREGEVVVARPETGAPVPEPEVAAPEPAAPRVVETPQADPKAGPLRPAYRGPEPHSAIDDDSDEDLEDDLEDDFETGDDELRAPDTATVLPTKTGLPQETGLPKETGPGLAAEDSDAPRVTFETEYVTLQPESVRFEEEPAEAEAERT